MSKKPTYQELEKELKKLRKELADNSKTTQALLDNILHSSTEMSVAATDINLNITYFNSRAEHIFGYKKNDIIGKNLTEIHAMENIEFSKIENAIKIVREKGKYEYYVNSNTDEGIKHFKSIVSGIWDFKEKLVGFVLFTNDITEQVNSQKEIKKLSVAVEQSANSIIITDLDGNIEYVNSKFLDITGYTENEVKGKNPRILNAQKQALQYYIDLWKTITKGEIWKGEFCNKTKYGNLFWEQVTITPIKNDKNEIINYLAIKEDITIRKDTEQELHATNEELLATTDSLKETNKELLAAVQKIEEKEKRLKDIILISNDWLWEVDNSGNFTYVSGKIKSILGYEPSEIIGKPLFDLMHDAEKQRVILYFSETISKQKKVIDFENWTIHKNGHLVCNQTNGRPIFDKRNNLIGYRGVNKDITEHKKIEDSFKESEARFRTIVTNSTPIIFMIDINGKMLLSEGKMLKTLGLKSGEVVGLSVFDLYKDYPIIIDNIKMALNGTTFEGVIKLDELFFEAFFSPNLDSEGNISGIIGMALDITLHINIEQKLKEQNNKYIALNEKYIATNDELLENNKEISLINKKLISAKKRAEESDRLKTEFINNMSHEIRTPMNGILGFSSLLAKENLSNEKRKYFIKIIHSSGNQLLQIIDDILEISKLGTKQVKTFEEKLSLNNFLTELFSVFEVKAKENKIPLYLKKGLSNKKSIIITDKNILNKVISNLINNAIKFTNSGYIEFGYNLVDNKLQIYVKDTGIGIRPEKQKIIFKRFSQEEKDITQKRGGLGLGLSIAKENIELIGGKISVESEKGKGAIFYITIPYKPVLLDSKIKNKKISNKKNKYTVLVVEDENINYLYLEILINDYNKKIKVIHAKNGKEAVEICKEKNDITLVLMDLKMPIMNGFEASMLIKSFRPKLPIIAQTAFSTTEDKSNALKAGCDEFVSKPINIKLFAEILSKYLK